MRLIAVTLFLVGGLFLSWPDSTAAVEKAKTASNFKPDRIDISYGEPQQAQLQPIYKLVRERRLLEKIRDLLRPLRFPHRLFVQTQDCGGIANAFSNDESVTVCYELLDEYWKNAPQETTLAGITPIDAIIGPTVDVFLHETGHALFQALHIPVFGREEDAADQFSTYVMLRFDKEEARRLVLGSAYQYKNDLSPTVTVKLKQFSDEHGVPAQRFFSLLCVAYGADPKLFEDIVSKGFLPEGRAVGCDGEFKQLSFAFNTLIGPYIDKRLARKLNRRWLPSSIP
jgi:hypothetical protein